MRRPAPVALGGAAIVAVLALAAGYAYFFSGLRSTPKPLALSSATPSAQASAASTQASSGLAGGWSVSRGSVARYRVNEVFAGTTSNHEAVAETSQVTGSATIRGTTAQPVLADLNVTADLTALHSIDSVAGFNVSQRDRIVQQQLSTSRYPQATFAAQNVTLPSDLGSGFTVAGELTIHGATKAENVTIKQLEVNGSSAEAVGQVVFDMTDFGVQPPMLPITTVQPKVTLEFDLKLAKA